MYTDAEYAIALASVMAQAEKNLGGPLRSEHPIGKVVELRLYAKSNTDLGSENLTAEQAAWKVIFSSLTDILRNTDPKMVADMEALDERVDALDDFKYALEAYKMAHPNDYGFKVPLVFMIVGSLVGFFRSPELTSVLIGGFVAWIAGWLFSIFVMNSAAVQLWIGFRLEGTALTRIGRWFIHHTLKDYARKQ